MAEVDLTIVGRPYRVACRDGEEDNLRAAAVLVDAKSREAIAGLGTLSEARQLLFASLLLADQLVEGRPDIAPAAPDPEVANRVNALTLRLETLASLLENQ